jgi:hypothetical protein
MASAGCGGMVMKNGIFAQVRKMAKYGKKKLNMVDHKTNGRKKDST